MNVGDISRTTDGYLIKKVQEDGIQRERWAFLHRLVWEEHNGPIPEGKMVSFLDGNKDNCDINNLVLVDNEINLELNRSDLRSEHAEITEVGVAIATLKVATRSRKKRRKK